MAKTSAARAAVIALAGVVLGSVPTHAQERDPAAAQALFDQAQGLMNAGRYAEACPKLAESLRLDPGIGTQFHLAACHEHEGKLASAWAAFLEVASLATATGQDARAKAATRRASLLEPRLPRLKVVVPAASRAAGLEITRAGVIVGEAQWQLALPVDPGVHRLEVTAPGRRAFAESVNAVEGAIATFEVPVLEATAVSTHAVATATPAPAASARPAARPPAPPTRSAPSDRAPQAPHASAASSGPGAIVIGLGIGGAALVGGGAVLALVAQSKYDDSKQHCSAQDENRCSEQGVGLRDDAFLFGHLATAAFIAGGALIATAGALLLTGSGTEPSGEQPAVQVGAGPAGASVAVAGRF